MSAGLKVPDSRIDLAIVGQLTAIKPGGPFWYMEMCRDLYVMCVTYQSNDLKVGFAAPIRASTKIMSCSAHVWRIGSRLTPIQAAQIAGFQAAGISR